MRIRAARVVQRLALAAGLCAGAWVAAEGLDHGTAWADDVPVRAEETMPAPGSGGGWGASDPPGAGTTPRDLVDGILDEVLPDPAPTEPTPAPEPTEPPAVPVLDEIGEVVDGILDALPITTPTPEPADGDDGTQHPVDTPPAPAPVIDVPPAEGLIPGLPGTPEVIETDEPAPYWPVTETQTVPLRGEPVCDSRGVTPAAPRPDTRGQPESPRAPADPGPLQPPPQPLQPCGPGGPDTDNGQRPVTGKQHTDLLSAATLTRAGALDYRRPAAPHPRNDDALPESRITLWPPGPG